MLHKIYVQIDQMIRPSSLIILFSLLSIFSIGQEEKALLPGYKHADSSQFKIVMRTEEDTGVRNVSLDNMTVRIKGDTTTVYYTHYGDMMISSLTIPYNVVDSFIELEKEIITQACTEDCTYSIVIKVGNRESRIPIDVLYVEKISSFMLRLEE